MPEAMRSLHENDFDFADGDGIDFEPYAEFLSRTDTESWIRAWTGNDALDGAEFLVFGQDGSGGYAAFWCVRPNSQVLEQPIVFLGSEGDRAVIARNFADYLWVLAAGIGPMEACEGTSTNRARNASFEAFALAHAPDERKTAAAAIAAARQEFPDFDDFIKALSR